MINHNDAQARKQEICTHATQGQGLSRDEPAVTIFLSSPVHIPMTPASNVAVPYSSETLAIGSIWNNSHLILLKSPFTPQPPNLIQEQKLEHIGLTSAGGDHDAEHHLDEAEALFKTRRSPILSAPSGLRELFIGERRDFDYFRARILPNIESFFL